MMSATMPTVNYDLATDTGRCVFTIRPGFDSNVGRRRTIDHAVLPELNRHDQIVTTVSDGDVDAVQAVLARIADAIGVRVYDLHVTYRHGTQEAINTPNSRHCVTGVDSHNKTRFASV